MGIKEGTPFLGETAGRKIRGLWLDWEDSGQPIAKRAQLLLGEWHGKHLARMDMRGRPLTDMADSLRRKIAKEGIGFIVIDSIGKACGSDASSQEVANKFSNAVDSLGVVALGIHHVTKNADSAGKPFGSTFWHGNARATIEVMGDPGGANGERHLVLANRKVNHGNILPAIGLQILYTDNKITLTKELPRYSNIRKAGIEFTVHDLVHDCLMEGDKTVKQIAAAVGKPDATVRKVLDRQKGFTFYQREASGGVGQSVVWSLTSSVRQWSNTAPVRQEIPEI